MNERITAQRPHGNSGQTLKNWALLFMAAGIIGRAVIENRIISSDASGLAQSLETMELNSGNIALVVSDLILRILNSCAIPLFLFLLVEGAMHTSNFGYYFLRIAGLALVSEIPYDLAMNNAVFYWKEQNPVFGLLFGLIMIYFFKTYAKGKLKSVLLFIFVTLFSCIWMYILRIYDGMYIIIVTATLWMLRNHRRIQVYIGALVACLCVTLPDFREESITYAMFYMASPLAFLLVFRYNEEPGEGSRWMNYAAYPVLLLSAWIVGIVLF